MVPFLIVTVGGDAPYELCLFTAGCALGAADTKPAKLAMAKKDLMVES